MIQMDSLGDLCTDVENPLPAGHRRVKGYMVYCSSPRCYRLAKEAKETVGPAGRYVGEIKVKICPKCNDNQYLRVDERWVFVPLDGVESGKRRKSPGANPGRGRNPKVAGDP